MGGKSVNKFQLEKCNDTHKHTGDDWISRLPDDILVGILSTLPLKEAARTSILSPRWENLWKHTLHLNFDTNHHTGVDWISRLPDYILVGILSTLPLKEAARTSVLSPRWENLWKHTLHLNFDADSALCRIVRHRENTKIRTFERRKYINWVNKVIRSHKGFALKELRICFDLDKSSAQKSINHWLRFAFERRVERLELDLSVEGDFGRCSNVCVLPMKKFRPHQSRSIFDSLKYLKALSLKSVDVTEQDVDVFLRSCPLLEHLVIDHADKISNLNICGAFALKHLEIIFCVHLKSLKVSAPNLISLKVTQADTLLLENVPKLVDVCVHSLHEQVHLVRALFCCLSQLEILTLDLYINKELMEKYSKWVPELPRLKKLEIVFSAKGDESMIGLTSLIRAAPCIQELVIKISWFKLLRTRKNVKNEIFSPHQHLKVVKFLGYYGRASDEELVRYLLDNCVVLEKLIIDPRYQPWLPHLPLNPDDIDGLVVDGDPTKGKRVYPEKFDGLDAVRTSRKYAKEQRQAVPRVLQQMSFLSVEEKLVIAKRLCKNAEDLDIFFNVPPEEQVVMVRMMLDGRM